MTEESASTLENPGCLALFVSTGLAALLLTLTPTIFPPGFVTPLIYVPIFVVTAFIGAVIGLPLYLVARHFRQENVWAATAAGALTGAAMPLVSALSEPTPQQWLAVAGYAAAGVAGGLAFYLTATARRAPRRNAALLAALTCASAAAALWAAPLAAEWLSPPAPSSAAR